MHTHTYAHIRTQPYQVCEILCSQSSTLPLLMNTLCWLALSSPCQFLSLPILPCLSSAPALPPYPSFNLVVLFSVGLCPDLLRCLLAVCLPPFLGVKQHHGETREQHGHHVTDPADTNYNFSAEV